MILRYAAIYLMAIAIVCTAEGRAVRAWSYEELLESADLVAIIEPVETNNTKDTYTGFLYGFPATDFQGMNTRFRVLATLKGKAPPDSPLVVLHFSYSRNVTVIINGARFAQFVPGPLQFKKQILKDEKEIGGITVYQEMPAWLAFLKMREDGRYESVTDPYDSADSFRELHKSSFFIPFR